MPSDPSGPRAACLILAACVLVLGGLSGCAAELAVLGVAAAVSAVTPKPPEQTELAARAYWQQTSVVCPAMEQALEQNSRKRIDPDSAFAAYRFSFPAPDGSGAVGGTLRATCMSFGATTIVTLLGTGPPVEESARRAATQLLDDLEATLGTRGIEAGPPHRTNKRTVPHDAATVYAALLKSLEGEGRTIVDRDPASGTVRVSYPFSLVRNNWGGTLTIVCSARGSDTEVTITSDGRDADTRVARIGDEILAALTDELRAVPRSP